MDAREDDARPPADGFWSRVRTRLVRARDRVVGGSKTRNSTADGSSDGGRGDEAVAKDGRGDDARQAEPIMTPEERVIEVVSENGGGMRQSEIVSRLDWSESTVSRKLSALESEEAVTRYQIGREKLVYLPGHEPETLGSPFGRPEADRPSSA